MIFGRKKNDEQPIRQARLDIEEQSYAFRRSRTLTGSSSSDISAVGESRAQIKSPRIKTHELKHQRRLIILGLLGGVSAIGACVWLLDQYTLTLNTVSATTPLVKQVDIDAYRKVADEYFGARPFERFRFMLNEERFQAAMTRQLPEIQSISLQNARGLVATDAFVSVRRPVAVWQSDSDRLYVDQAGRTFTRNYYQEPTVTIEDQSGIAISGQTKLVASSRLLTFAGRLVAGIDDSGVGTVTKVAIPLGALRQLDISLQGKPYRIKTHMDREPTGQVADVVSAVKYFDAHLIIPEYIDVRVEGKAYYR